MEETGELLLSAVFLTESGLLVGQVGCDVLVEELMCNFSWIFDVVLKGEMGQLGMGRVGLDGG